MDYLAIDSRIGERIRYYRQKKGLTQKTLAELCGLSEAAIRNYELGNRTPDSNTIEKIAENLEISYHTINDPTIEDVFGALHTLFRMEEIYGLHPEVSGSKIRLTFEDTSLPQQSDSAGRMLSQAVQLWYKMYKKYKHGTISSAEYENWKSQYPEFIEIIN